MGDTRHKCRGPLLQAGILGLFLFVVLVGRSDGRVIGVVHQSDRLPLQEELQTQHMSGPHRGTILLPWEQVAECLRLLDEAGRTGGLDQDLFSETVLATARQLAAQQQGMMEQPPTCLVSFRGKAVIVAGFAGGMARERVDTVRASVLPCPMERSAEIEALIGSLEHLEGKAADLDYLNSPWAWTERFMEFAAVEEKERVNAAFYYGRFGELWGPFRAVTLRQRPGIGGTWSFRTAAIMEEETVIEYSPMYGTVSLWTDPIGRAASPSGAKARMAVKLVGLYDSAKGGDIPVEALPFAKLEEDSRAHGVTKEWGRLLWVGILVAGPLMLIGLVWFLWNRKRRQGR